MQVIFGRIYIFQVDPFGIQGVAGLNGGFLPDARIEDLLTLNGQGLKITAGAEFSRLMGNVQVNKDVMPVLSFIDNASFRVNGYGFMIEATHFLRSEERMVGKEWVRRFGYRWL